METVRTVIDWILYILVGVPALIFIVVVFGGIWVMGIYFVIDHFTDFIDFISSSISKLTRKKHKSDEGR